MGKYVNGVYVPENETDAFALGKFSNGHPQNQTAPASPTLTPEQEENLRIGAEMASRMTNPEQTSFNMFAKPQPTQPVATPTTPAKTTPVNTTPVNQNTQTQNPYGQIASMDDLAKAMGYTSPQEEDRLRKASVANQRILAVGDALRQIGNIYNTTRYAPSQQFNSPIELERQRYLQGKALRDKANQTYLTYQQAKAKQDADQRRWEAEQQAKADQWNATFKYNAARDAARLKNAEDQWKANLSYKAKNDDANRAQRQKQYDAQNALRRQSVGIQAQNSRNAENYRQWKMKNSAGGGRGANPYLYAAPNGGTLSLPRSLNSVQIDQIVTNPDFKKYRNRTALQEAMIHAGVQTNDPAQVRRYEAAMMIAQHPDVAEWAAGRFGGSVNGMQPTPVVQQQSGMNGYIAPGNTWSQPGSNFDWSQYLSGISAQDDAMTDDEDEETYDWDEFEVH